MARRLACALWHVHRKAKVFSYDQYRLTQRLVVPDEPLANFLDARAVRLLNREGIDSTAALAEAYTEGRLASIFGLGQQTIERIKQWIIRSGRFPRREPGGNGAGKPANHSSGRGYVLNSAATFQPARTGQTERGGSAKCSRCVTKGK